MLSRSDADLVERDRGIAGLAALLDPALFATELSRVLPGIALERGPVTYLKYKPGQSCMAAHRLGLVGGTIDVYAKAYRDGAADKLAKRPKHVVEGALGPGFLLVENLRTTVYVFPNDAKVRGLCGLDPKTLRTLRYKPERRYVGRLLDGSGAVRAYDAAGYPGALAAANAFRSRGPLRVARCLGASDSGRILTSEWLEGEPLDALLGGGAPVEEAFATTGAALAELHAQPVRDLRRRPASADATSAVSLGRWLCALWPPLGPRALSIARRLASRLRTARARSAPIHGDFYGSQVLLCGSTVAALLDLDESACGDPAADLGNFLARLDGDVLSGRVTRSRRDEAAGAFLRGYSERHEADGSFPSRVALHEALGVFRLAPRPFRERHPEWPTEIEGLLGATEDLLEAVEAQSAA